MKLLLLAIVLGLFTPVNLAQQPETTKGLMPGEVQAVPSKELTPTPAQQTQLELKQKDAIIATQKLQLLQQQVQQAEMGRQQALAALNAQAEAIKKENKWPETTQFDPNDLEYSPKAAEKAKP